MRKLLLSLTVGLVTLLVPATLGASVLLYDNGPLSYDGGINISYVDGGVVSDSFTLSAPATLTSARVGLAVATVGGTVRGLSCSIGSGFFLGDLGSGCVSISSTLEGVVAISNGDHIYPYYELTLGFVPITLGAGTYYLTLSDAEGVDPNPFALEPPDVFWFFSAGPSSAEAYGFPVVSESFQIYSTYSAASTPEPGLFAVLGLGLAALALPRRARR